jgi:hypothetical protein
VTANLFTTQCESGCGFLIAASFASGLVALLHVGCIVYGAPWYRFFGAGEKMAQLAEHGSKWPTIITTFIVAMFVVWSLYGLSGAGLLPQLPLLRPALASMTAIYLLRAFAGVPAAFLDNVRTKAFWLWSSLICLAIGATHLMGLIQTWSLL